MGGVQVKLALIPPFQQLQTTDITSIQLMLPQLLRNTEYAKYYRKHCDNSDQYVILDNGAAENDQWTWEQLQIVAEEFPVNEIVLPDVMGDAQATCDKAFDILGSLSTTKVLPYKLGVVATGTSTEEAYAMVRELTAYYPYLQVIYIPRLLVTSEYKMARIDLALKLHQVYKDEIEIHFLGASKYFPHELHAAAQYGIVRSMDTSMPYNYAYHLAAVDQDGEISRPDNYFDQLMSMQQQDFMRYNILQMLRWSNAA